MYFSFFKLKKWGKKTAAARRHNCAPVAKELLYKINHIPPYYIMYTRAGTKAWL